jgi:hypothetical protein
MAKASRVASHRAELRTPRETESGCAQRRRSVETDNTYDYLKEHPELAGEIGGTIASCRYPRDLHATRRAAADE